MGDLPLDEDVQMAIELELRLLQPEVRSSAAELEKLLHPDFFEFGASGKKWGRSQTISALASRRLPGEDVPVAASDITGTRLADPARRSMAGSIGGAGGTPALARPAPRREVVGRPAAASGEGVD
jgi:hypothetical protein